MTVLRLVLQVRLDLREIRSSRVSGLLGSGNLCRIVDVERWLFGLGPLAVVLLHSWILLVENSNMSQLHGVGLRDAHHPRSHLWDSHAVGADD
jgi:hypothetical protein